MGSYCTRCGERLGIGDNYCRNCGKAVLPMPLLFTEYAKMSGPAQSGRKKCPQCNGKGLVSVAEAGALGLFATIFTLGIAAACDADCPTCKGKGWVREGK